MSSPLPQQASEGNSGGGIKVGIKRFQSVVQVNLHCHGEYQAIELYDRLVEAAERGEVQIDLRAGQVAQDSDKQSAGTVSRRSIAQVGQRS